MLRSARALSAEGQTDAQLLIKAERRVWRKMDHLERLPFYLVYGSLALLHFTTRSKLVLICLLYAYPALLLPVTLIACRWVDWLEPREAQQRWEYERLRGRQRRS